MVTILFYTTLLFRNKKLVEDVYYVTNFEPKPEACLTSRESSVASFNRESNEGDKN